MIIFYGIVVALLSVRLGMTIERFLNEKLATRSKFDEQAHSL